MKTKFFTAIAIAALFGLGLCLLSDNLAGVKQASAMPESNLKFYPKDMKQPDLYKEMRQISKDLGVKCAFCHVMTPRKDFVKDTPHKEIALKMLVLTKEINDDLKKIFPKGDKKVTCYTCHRGEEHPKNVGEDDGEDE